MNYCQGFIHANDIVLNSGGYSSIAFAKIFAARVYTQSIKVIQCPFSADLYAEILEKNPYYKFAISCFFNKVYKPLIFTDETRIISFTLIFFSL